MNNKYYYTKLTRIVVVVSSILFIIAMVLFIIIKSLEGKNTPPPTDNSQSTSINSTNNTNSNSSNNKKEKDDIKKPGEIKEETIKKDISFSGSLRISEKITTENWVATTIVATSIETDPALLIYKINTDGSRELVVGPTTTVARKRLISLGVPSSIIDSPVVAKYAHGGDE